MAENMPPLPPGTPALNTYYFYLTTGCNLACRHCWLSPAYQPDGGTGGHLDFGLFAQALEEAIPLGLSNVKLTGGEPLLHPDFLRMVDLLKEKNLGLSIETNGTLVTPELAKYLIEKSTLYHVSISLDGADSESHDKFRGVKGAFDKACEGVRAFVEVGYRPQVIMSLYTGNVNEIEALVQLSEAMGAGSVKFNIVQPSGRGEQMTKRGQLLDIQRLIETGKWIESDLQKRTSIQLYYSWPMAFHGLRRLLDKGADACGIFNILGILSNGQLAMCGIGMEIPELCFGQIGVDPITDVWCNHPTLKKLRHSLPGELEGVCGNCVFRYQCLGSCVAENYHQTRRLTAPFWFCQQAKQAGLFPIERLREGMYNQV